MSRAKFHTNINCMSCVAKVTPVLNQLENVDEWKVDTSTATKELEVELDDDNYNAVIEALKQIGYTAELAEKS